MKLNRVEWALLGIALVSAIAVVLTYVSRFHNLPVGDPTDWSSFGDYLGGVLNQIIGIVTVVLVVQTLQTTRREAADTRYEMHAQVQLLKRQAVLADMHKRLDGALAEWNRLLDQVAPHELQFMQYTTMDGGVVMSDSTVRDILESPRRRKDLLDRKKAHEGRDRFVAKEWTVFKHDLIPLLCEIDRYCLDYEKVAESGDLTDFYKARVRTAARAIRDAGLLQDTVAERLAPY